MSSFCTNTALARGYIASTDFGVSKHRLGLKALRLGSPMMVDSCKVESNPTCAVAGYPIQYWAKWLGIKPVRLDSACYHGRIKGAYHQSKYAPWIIPDRDDGIWLFYTRYMQFSVARAAALATVELPMGFTKPPKPDQSPAGFTAEYWCNLLGINESALYSAITAKLLGDAVWRYGSSPLIIPEGPEIRGYAKAYHERATDPSGSTRCRTKDDYRLNPEIAAGAATGVKQKLCKSCAPGEGWHDLTPRYWSRLTSSKDGFYSSCSKCRSRRHFERKSARPKMSPRPPRPTLAALKVQAKIT